MLRTKLVIVVLLALVLSGARPSNAQLMRRHSGPSCLLGLSIARSGRLVVGV